jgi:hypothetical protein
MMTTGGSASPDSERVDWATYAKDARNFLLATSHAGPTAARVWTEAWCEWATSVAKMHEQWALRWNGVIKDPARGPAVLNEMQKSFKDYLVAVGTIPDRAIMKFTVAMETSVGTATDVPSPRLAFIKVAEDATAGIVDAFNLYQKRLEYQRAAQSTLKAQAAEPDDPDAAALRDIIPRLNAALAQLRDTPEQSTG